MGQDARGAAFRPSRVEESGSGKKNIYRIIIQTGYGLSLSPSHNLTDFRELITTEVRFLELRPRYRTG